MEKAGAVLLPPAITGAFLVTSWFCSINAGLLAFLNLLRLSWWIAIGPPPGHGSWERPLPATSGCEIKRRRELGNLVDAFRSGAIAAGSEFIEEGGISWCSLAIDSWLTLEITAGIACVTRVAISRKRVPYQSVLPTPAVSNSRHAPLMVADGGGHHCYQRWKGV